MEKPNIEKTVNLKLNKIVFLDVYKRQAHYVTQEYGSSYYMLKTLKQAFDPNGIMNMGTLIPLRK